MVHICANKDCIDIPLSNAFFSSCEDMVQIQLMLKELSTQDFEDEYSGAPPGSEPRPRGYKSFSILNSAEHEISNAHKYKISRHSAFFRLR